MGERNAKVVEALGAQVRRAVELLVAAIGRIDLGDRALGGPGLVEMTAPDVYRGAVATMMRIVFLFFAEDRGLLAARSDGGAEAFGPTGVCAELERRAVEGGQRPLDGDRTAWRLLLALFATGCHGVGTAESTRAGGTGSPFDPGGCRWLPSIDDRTVLHLLRAVRYVDVGTGRAREHHTLRFRDLDVEQLGYVYEGLLSYECLRAETVTVGLSGRDGSTGEIPLADLESLLRGSPDPSELAAALAERFSASGVGTPAMLARRLAPAGTAARESARGELLTVTGGDRALAERLLPFRGIMRADLRGLPVVILPGALFVTGSALRRNTGSHYTPGSLAAEIVEGALEPLVYSPGPLQTADRSAWRLRTSTEILSLRVADIAMGSAAFLIAAARYLGSHLMAARSRETGRAAGVTPPSGVTPAGVRQPAGVRPPAGVRRPAAAGTPPAVEDPLVVEARRQVIRHCLYGVDINPMAVEVARLSLWLVAMDPSRPFTFLDDRLVSGDSLLGITSPDQLDHLRLADQTTDPERLRLLADLIVGAALAHPGEGAAASAAGLARADGLAGAGQGRQLADGLAGAGQGRQLAERQRRSWLAADLVPGAFERRPLHWPLVFPEVFARGGFDAIVGNPPFLHGSRIRAACGTAYREYLVRTVARGKRGNADLVTYFVVRAHELLNPSGQTGLIATNTLAQGDSREVGLDQLTANGTVTIRKAIRSRPWPARSAVLEYCAIWTSRATVAAEAERLLDGVAVAQIGPALEPRSRVAGDPLRLRANAGVAFLGSKIEGIGFTLAPEDAGALRAKDRRYGEVLYPFLNGRDLNSRPDCSASRWVINFHDWPRERAASYPDCYARVVNDVKPERDRNNRAGRRIRWWQYGEGARGLYAAMAELSRVIVIARVSSTVMPCLCPTGQVFSDSLAVFATDDTAMLAVLSSAPHYWWAVSHGSSMKADLRYTPSDVFETLPLPAMTMELREHGRRLDSFRRAVMVGRRVGLTGTYKLVHLAACQDEDIVELRRIHRAIDAATCRAYGWADLLAQGLEHGWYDRARETRYTVGPAVRREMLALLLELNHERRAAEVAAGRPDRRTHDRGGSGKGDG